MNAWQLNVMQVATIKKLQRNLPHFIRRYNVQWGNKSSRVKLMTRNNSGRWLNKSSVKISKSMKNSSFQPQIVKKSNSLNRLFQSNRTTKTRKKLSSGEARTLWKIFSKRRYNKKRWKKKENSMLTLQQKWLKLKATSELMWSKIHTSDNWKSRSEARVHKLSMVLPLLSSSGTPRGWETSPIKSSPNKAGKNSTLKNCKKTYA